jgi:hypothetical protein
VAFDYAIAGRRWPGRGDLQTGKGEPLTCAKQSKKSELIHYGPLVWQLRRAEVAFPVHELVVRSVRPPLAAGLPVPLAWRRAMSDSPCVINGGLR